VIDFDEADGTHDLWMAKRECIQPGAEKDDLANAPLDGSQEPLF